MNKEVVKKYEVISHAIADLERNNISVPESLLDEKYILEKEFEESRELIEAFESLKNDIGSVNRRISKLKITEKKEKAANPRKSPSPSTKIYGFRFNNINYEINSWVGMFGLVNEIISSNNENDFEKVLELRGKKKPYYSIFPYELRSPKKVIGTNIYFEANLSAASISQMILKLLDLFDYKEEDFKIHYK
ncbi:MAG: hypothetical protein PHV39_09210 [Methanomicrobium sp.]|nr:hypothetical protein [Methanomicrobium sp.]